MIKNLKCEDGRWSWTSWDGTQYHTDKYGEGVWKVIDNAHEYGHKQVKGTCQFTLAGYTMDGARKKINRELEPTPEEIEILKGE